MSDSAPSGLRLLIALVYGGGAVLLLLLLTKDNPDELAARLGVTAAGLIVLGLVAAAGARLFVQSDLASLWGWATVLVAIVTFVLLMVEVWPEDFFLGEARMWAMAVISILFGGGSLVLSGEPEEADQATRIAAGAAIVALLALGVMTVLAVSEVDIGPRWFGVASAVFLVSALSLPLLRLTTGERDGAF